ncbi:MAG: hypothetical protein ACI84R_003985, partial [Candidatus Azotimanducaceae bacterium]
SNGNSQLQSGHSCSTQRADCSRSLHQPFAPFDVEKRSFRPAEFALTRFWNEICLRAISIQIGDLP